MHGFNYTFITSGLSAKFFHCSLRRDTIISKVLYSSYMLINIYLLISANHRSLIKGSSSMSSSSSFRRLYQLHHQPVIPVLFFKEIPGHNLTSLRLLLQLCFLFSVSASLLSFLSFCTWRRQFYSFWFPLHSIPNIRSHLCMEV